MVTEDLCANWLGTWMKLHEILEKQTSMPGFTFRRCCSILADNLMDLERFIMRFGRIIIIMGIFKQLDSGP